MKRTCVSCGAPFEGAGRKIFCTTECRVRTERARYAARVVTNDPDAVNAEKLKRVSDHFLRLLYEEKMRAVGS
jgi:hypothetical protein